jgi:hypothetical protein
MQRGRHSLLLVAVGCAVLVLIVAVVVARASRDDSGRSRWQKGMDAVYSRCRAAGGAPNRCRDQVLKACLNDRRWDGDPFSSPYHQCPAVADVASER